MKKKYKHVLFDLDHTLWDFEKNSCEVLFQLYDDFQLYKLGKFSKEDFCSQFKTINQQLWKLYNQDVIDKNAIRKNRFNLIFDAFGVKNQAISSKLAEEYLRRCPTMAHVFPYTMDVLRYLKFEKGYHLHIITNGFEDVQHIKLTSSRLNSYFQEVVTADAVGFQKPHKQIFDFALNKLCCTHKDCIMIGDNLEADILGAKNAEIDQVFFNPMKIPHKETITHEISCLSELLKIL